MFSQGYGSSSSTSTQQSSGYGSSCGGGNMPQQPGYNSSQTATTQPGYYSSSQGGTYPSAPNTGQQRIVYSNQHTSLFRSPTYQQTSYRSTYDDDCCCRIL